MTRRAALGDRCVGCDSLLPWLLEDTGGPLGRPFVWSGSYWHIAPDELIRCEIDFGYSPLSRTPPRPPRR